jgi:hypothetical protein
VAHPQADTLIGIKTQVLKNGEHSGYPILEAAATRFETAIGHEQDQALVSAAASKILAACTRLGL